MITERIVFIKSIIDMLPEHMFSKAVATWIGCQFALESNYGRSGLTVEYFNADGMKMPRVRCTTAMSKNPYGFASFPSLQDCVIDYCIWLGWNRFSQKDCDSLGIFKSRLKIKGYCPESDYFNRVDSIYQDYLYSLNA